MELFEMPFNDVFDLYEEKKRALRDGDIEKLLALKRKYPELFNSEKAAQICDMIDYCKAFQASDRYKELKRMDLKSKLTVISNDLQDQEKSRV